MPSSLDDCLKETLSLTGSLDDLTHELQRLSLDEYLRLNDSARKDNCVWVSTARLLGFDSVLEMEREVKMEAPRGGALDEQLQAFRMALMRYYEEKKGFTLTWTLLHNKLPSTSDCVVVFAGPNGQGHCINREKGRFVDYQQSDEGLELFQSEQGLGNSVRFSWFFECARWDPKYKEVGNDVKVNSPAARIRGGSRSWIHRLWCF